MAEVPERTESQYVACRKHSDGSRLRNFDLLQCTFQRPRRLRPVGDLRLLMALVDSSVDRFSNPSAEPEAVSK
jgi:hypothetical protein